MARANLALSDCIDEMACTPVNPAEKARFETGEVLNVTSGQSPARDLQRRLEAAVMESFGDRSPTAKPKGLSRFLPGKTEAFALAITGIAAAIAYQF